MYGYTESAGFSLFRIVKAGGLCVGLGWFLFTILPALKNPYRIKAMGEYTPLALPYASAPSWTSSNGQTYEVKALWRFNVSNVGSQQAQNVVFQLPFDGFYKLERHNPVQAPGVADFQKSIPLGTLQPGEQATVLIWTGSEANPGFEKETRLTHEQGTIAIEYPVRLSGFLAWVERNQSLLALLIVLGLLLLLL